MVLPASRRLGARMNGMVSICERSINVVKTEQAKDAARLAPKGTVVGEGLPDCPSVDTQHHRRTERTFPILFHLLNTVSPSSSRQGRAP